MFYKIIRQESEPTFLLSKQNLVKIIKSSCNYMKGTFYRNTQITYAHI